jgi:hypothetical protein
VWNDAATPVGLCCAQVGLIPELVPGEAQHQALGMRHRIVQETVLGFAALSTNLQKQSDAAWETRNL